jgi:hypothetical protein
VSVVSLTVDDSLGKRKACSTYKGNCAILAFFSLLSSSYTTPFKCMESLFSLRACVATMNRFEKLHERHSYSSLLNAATCRQSLRPYSVMILPFLCLLCVLLRLPSVVLLTEEGLNRFGSCRRETHYLWSYELPTSLAGGHSWSALVGIEKTNRKRGQP